MKTFLFSKNRRIALIRGLLAVTLAYSLLSFIVSLFWKFTGIVPPAENFASVEFVYLFLLALVTLFLTIVLPRPRSLFLGLSLGGSLTNYINSNLFSPVADYLLIPGTSDHYFNLPDLGIILGPTFYALFALRELWILERRDRERRPRPI